MWKNLKVWGKLLVCILPLALVIIGSSFVSYRAQSLMSESAHRVEECEELRATFLNRAIDHFKWAQTLALYVAMESSSELNLVTDPTQCAFGKWYASQERRQAENLVPGLGQALRKIDAPQTALHTSALGISAAALCSFTYRKRQQPARNRPEKRPICSASQLCAWACLSPLSAFWPCITPLCAR